MGKSVYHVGLTQFVFLLYLQLVLSSQLSSDQVSTMTQVYEIFQNSTGSSFVWNDVRKDSSPCSWKGISCNNDNSSIVGLSFRFFSLSTSKFLPLLCKIDTLVSLDVSNNQLTAIPDGFFTLCGGIRELKLLNFSGNKLVGSLPAFNGFKMVEFLDCSDNLFSGEIGLELDEMDSLKSLNLSRNMFVGSVPTSLGKLNLLQELQLSFNDFTGEIPAQLTKYSNVKLIDLRNNKLSGSIPEKLGGLTKLEILILSLNCLSGGIPTSLSNVTTLQRFAANQNNFNGTIPSGISLYLKALDLSYNSLTGTIPSDILSGPNLESLDLSHNGLEGLIPGNLSINLFRIRLGSNSLKGMIPVGSLGNLVELTYLELDNNSLNGTIPIELAMCRKLALLNLAQNQLTGPLPPALGNLINLRALYLRFNDFVGEIPLSISRLKYLEKLDLQGNNLSGPIPDSIRSLHSLIEIQLGKNQLSGFIPEMPLGLNIALNLSYNLFEGPIPVTLSRLSRLGVLDLSHNRFSGKIPDSLTRMTSLTLLVLSDNELSGVVPMFGPFVDVERDGNNGLIENETNLSPPSPNKRKSLSLDIIISVAAAAVAVVLLIMIALFISRRYYRINDEYLHSEEEISPSHVIHGNLLTPSSIHRSNIDFRTAMEAVTDPSNVVLKERFSTYYKVVMPSSNSYFVKKLNWSDKILQLGTHNRFGEELKVFGALCNSNAMIPLAYVLTGDDAYIFYDFTPKGTLSDVLHKSTCTTLDWVNRYCIAIGVAQGLTFLHECNSGPILLLDLSSKSIHLKSLDEPQIGDIELCKVIDPSKNISSLSAVAGSVGYIPPEYAYTMRVTEAGNVYSYGVLLLELLTGKPAVIGGTELAKWVLCNSVQQDNWHKILDIKVSETSPDSRRQMLAVLKVALSCISISPGLRPKMKTVLRMLLNASEYAWY